MSFYKNMKDLFIQFIIFLPFIVFIKYIVSPLTRWRCDFGIHDYVFSSTKEGMGMNIKRTKGDKLGLSFSDRHYYRCSHCGKYNSYSTPSTENHEPKFKL